MEVDDEGSRSELDDNVEMMVKCSFEGFSTGDASCDILHSCQERKRSAVMR